MPTFAWDDRPGHNVEHIARHGISTDLWEEIYHRATVRSPDKDDATVVAAEGRVRKQLYRIVYSVDDEGDIIPLHIIPITGEAISRRGL